MPESFLGLPPDSTGKRSRTWEDPVTGYHDQFVRLAQSRGGQLFFAGSDLITATATANLRLWQISNTAATGGKAIWVRKVTLQMHAVAAAVAVAVTMRRTTDAPTTGTVINPVSYDATTTPGSVAAVRALPTSGTLSGGSFGSTLTPSGAGGSVTNSMHNSDLLTNRQIWIPPGAGLQIGVVGTPDADHRVVIECLWEEV